MASYILAIDQGTTSSRAILFDGNLEIVAISQKEFAQHFSRSGWVEHDPEDIWNTVLSTSRDVIAQAGIDTRNIASTGITNQRETTLVWDRDTGKAVYPAIVWQDRRTAGICSRLIDAGHEPQVSATTGLLLDPYFSASKIAWILDNVDGARQKAMAGKLAFGTVDTFLLWRLTGGREHATDATNASRTMLYDIHTGDWSGALLELFDIPPSMLSEVKDSSALFGHTEKSLLGAQISISGIAGDQQAASIGQACFAPGMMKSTYGTGCFAMLNTGDMAVTSRNRLLTTIASQINGKPAYALEGSIFIAGAAVQWLRDELGFISDAGQSGSLAASASPGQNVYLVPAFTGMGAPYWDANARGAMFGLTRDTGPAEITRAALEAVCYQTKDLLVAMQADCGFDGDTILRVDGGMSASDWTMQRLADLLDAPVDRPKIKEATALGAAYLAGLEAGILPPPGEFAKSWALERRFEPQMDPEERDIAYAGWKDAVRRTLTD